MSQPSIKICDCGHTALQHDYWQGAVRGCTSIRCRCKAFTMSAPADPAAVPPLASQEWQPISTAPKDGRGVLLLSAPITHDAGVNGIVHHPPRCHIAHWWAEGTSWVDEFGRIEGDAYRLAVTGVWLPEQGGWFQPNEVTHWMPLPLPPPLSPLKA